MSKLQEINLLKNMLISKGYWIINGIKSDFISDKKEFANKETFEKYKISINKQIGKNKTAYFYYTEL